MPRIVIIGGGSAGINCAQTLAQQLKAADNTEVVLLEKSAFFYHVIATPRAYVDETFVPKLFIPYDNAIPMAASTFVKIVRAVVTQIKADTNEVHFRKIGADDREGSEVETLQFDYLVIATGSTYTVPIKPDGKDYARTTTEAKLKEVHQRIENADKILIVGGGAVGCEVAGDIASKYPSKSVTILESRDKLIAGNDLREKFHRLLHAALAKLKIKVILGERLEERLRGNCFEKRTLKTTKGTEIESDIQLLCGGFHPRQVPPHIRTGDTSNHATPKLGYWTGEQGKHVAHELVATVHGKPKVAVEALILPLDPGGGVVGDMMTRMVKGKDMFASKMWGDLGAEIPH
ncbi:Apoptosis-inducing factor b, partial [Globisporangium splendens]